MGIGHDYRRESLSTALIRRNI